jgi:hypothetical protein
MSMRGVFKAALAAFVAAAVPLSPASAWVQGAAQSSSLDFLTQPNKLKPGQWVWDPQVAPDGPLLVYVDLSRQIATVYRNGVKFGVTTVSSGRPGYDTPTGIFTILQKDADHHSSKYNDAPMPFTERLTWGGVALHAGGLPGYPSSHGCVHLPIAFAKRLFGVESLGGTVVIAGRHNDPVTAPAAGLLEPAVAGANAPAPVPSGQQFTWNPAASKMGAVSIVVSAADRQAVVLRNGVEIGRSVAEIPQQPEQTKVMTYAGGANDAWIAVGVGDSAGQSGGGAGIQQLKLPPAFTQHLYSVIAPGTTLVVTQAPLGPQSTGPQTVVMDAHDGNTAG